MSKTETAVEVRNLHKSYGDLEVLKGINLKVEKGCILALLGPNGAGKTTTIRILSTLLLPDKGNATVNGYDVANEADKVKSSIGLTGQFAAVDEYLTGEENLRMIGRLYRLSPADSKNRAKELLKQLDLVEAGSRAAKTYSGGMKRRLDLAMSLIASPPVIFLDEPTTGLDPRSRLTMWRIIKDLASSGTTIFLTTQYMDEADHLADQIVVIDNGKVIAEGTPDELKKSIGKEQVELSFKTLADFEKAKVAIGKLAAKTNQEELSMTIPNDKGVSRLRGILETFESNQVNVESLSLHKPTLDDVFLKLTGHKAVSDDGKKSAKKKKGKK